MWSKLLNLFIIQVFLLQSFAFAAPKKYLTGTQLSEVVSALKQLSTDEQKKLYISVLPFIHKEDKKVIDEKFFFDTIKNLSVEGNNLVLNVEGEKGTVTKIDLEAWTAKLDGKTIHAKKSVKENLEQFFETEHKTSFFDFIIPSAHAQKNPPIPSKLKLIGLVIAGTVVALCAVGAGVWGWVKADKTAHTVAIQEVQAPKIEEVISNDCKDQKEQVKRGRLGEKMHQGSEFIKKMRDKISMLNETKAEAIKAKMTQKDMEWIENSKTCYGEVIELIELQSAGVNGDARAPKEVPNKAAPLKPAQAKSTKQ